MAISRRAGIASVVALLAASCQEKPAEQVRARPVKTITVEKRQAGEPVTLTAQIRSQDQVNLAFRLDGRMLDRAVGVGATISPGEVVARLDDRVQRNALQAAQANLSAAQGQLTQARNTLDRQQELHTKGFTTKAQLDQAQQVAQTTQAQIDSAEAQLRTAQEQLGYTELRADAAGTVTAVGAEPGEVVHAGQMIVQLARQNGKDAVFDVPAQLIRTAPRDPVVEVWLSDDPTVKTVGRVREVAPQADPVTRTFQVKVGLSDPPEAMRLGATVTGRIQLSTMPGFEVPASALTEANGTPAVWVVDRENLTVSLRSIEVLRFEPTSVVVSQGLADGEVVVTAGAHTLHPGQKVRFLEKAS